MTPKQFKLYYEQQIKRIEFDKEISDRQAARICCMLANINRNTKKKISPYKEDDFMPKKKQKMTTEQMATMLKVICLAYGGEING